MTAWKKIKHLISRFLGSIRFYIFIMERLFPDKMRGRPLNRGTFSGYDFEALISEYLETPLSNEPDTFVLYRIIGNDLPPRHLKGQTLKNFWFILENEGELKGCEKRFVLNRIVNPDEEKHIVEILNRKGYSFFRIPFDRNEYLQVGWDTNGVPDEFAPGAPIFQRLGTEEQGRIWMRLYRHKNNYVMNNNGARNAALAQGRQLAKWVLPWDGNCFITQKGWEEIVSSVTASPQIPHFVAPMARVLKNRLLLESDYAPRAEEEPQIIFRKDSLLSFNESYFYGRRPKVELLWRLGVPGKWDRWEVEPWDLPIPGYAAEAGAFNYAGWVARLNSGRGSLETDSEERASARVEAIKTMLDGVDKKMRVDAE